MNDLSKLFDRYCNVMNKNNKGVQIGVYTVALIGLSVAVRRVRPFSKFKKPTDIPNLFIRQRRELQGYVQGIEPNGGLLMVDHKPLLLDVLRTDGGALPVKLSNVQVTGHGISWLQAIVAHNQIKFIPIAKGPNYVQCEVLLSQTVPKKNITRQIDVGESLLSVGFGRLEKDSTDDLFHKKYINKLQAAEQKALRKQMGLKYYIEPTKLILFSIYERLKSLIMKKIKQKKSTTKKV